MPLVNAKNRSNDGFTVSLHEQNKGDRLSANNASTPNSSGDLGHPHGVMNSAAMEAQTSKIGIAPSPAPTS